jgi:hypothetical protein
VRRLPDRRKKREKKPQRHMNRRKGISRLERSQNLLPSQKKRRQRQLRKEETTKARIQRQSQERARASKLENLS